MDSKLDVRNYVYMIKNNRENFIYETAYESRSLAEFVMEIQHTEFWIQNKYVEVLEVPVKFLKKI